MMQKSLSQLFFRQFKKHKLAVLSALILLILSILVIFAPLILKFLGVDYFSTEVINRFKFYAPSHIMGTDELGRDVFARLLYGGRISLLVGLMCAIGASVLGTTLGLIAGYYGKLLDSILMRFTDGFLSVPMLPLLIILAAVDITKVPVLGKYADSMYLSVFKIVLIIVLTSWMQVARLVRGTVLSLKEREFILSSKVIGASTIRILLRHILPNSISPIIVSTTLAVGYAILIEAILSFLGLGIQPPLPSWGNMLFNAQEIIYSAPYLAIYPGALIFITVVCINFLGDGLQDAFDPKAIKR